MRPTGSPRRGVGVSLAISEVVRGTGPVPQTRLLTRFEAPKSTAPAMSEIAPIT